MSMIDLWLSGARDVFGYRFRDAWRVVGWEEGRVPEGYVCWLYSDWEPKPVTPIKPTAPQLELF